MANLWIVENFAGLLPRLQVWELLRETPDSYLVRLRDGERRFVKNATGRRYFTLESDAVEYLRQAYRHEQERSTRTVRRMERLACADDATILGFARGLDSIVDAIESAIRE